MTYREITFAKNQQVADQLLRECGIKADSSLPIDPEVILRKKGHLLSPMPNMKRDYGVLACVAKSGRSLNVYIDEYYYSNQEDRSLLTLGEELGHIYLHLLDLERVRSVDDWIKMRSENREHHKKIESQAQLFASNIVLPHFIFDQYVVDWVHANIHELERFPRISPDTVAWNIGLYIEDELGISPWILSITLQRWPNRLIDKILKEYPGLLSESCQ